MTKDYKITNEKHIWTSDLKLKFCGYGEWVEEADVTDIEYLGYKASVVRVFKKEPFAIQEAYFGGHLCGYVKIPENHPYFKKYEVEIDCHGGITFNEAHEEHWIGFDCAHSGDYIPTMEYFRKTSPELIEIRKAFTSPEGFETHPWFNPTYKNVNYCIQECMSMIDQLDVAANRPLVKEIIGNENGMDYD